MPTVAEQWIQQGVKEGRAKGMAEGLQRGELLGRIRTLEELLGREPSALESLGALTLEQLTQQAESLRAKLTK